MDKQFVLISAIGFEDEHPLEVVEDLDTAKSIIERIIKDHEEILLKDLYYLGLSAQLFKNGKPNKNHAYQRSDHTDEWFWQEEDYTANRVLRTWRKWRKEQHAENNE